ncbi:hypothetical protein [Streptomyces abyssomicinicus]|uniref:hypothetical protein n=1 Tax=Streptomyces abyssomicinicus TaxID=574929 RepID=UPI00124FE781|nr:hypothetical protein [Streptomyces abyssomicinicus]
METHIPLIVRNVDIDDDATAEQIALRLSDLGWHEAAGETVATVYTTGADPVTDAAAGATSIRRALPQAVIERVDEQFVSLADIAERTGLSHEAIRLWAAGKRRSSGVPFPRPRAQVGGQGRSATKIWSWPEVLVWLKAQYCLDVEPDTAYLTPQQVMRVNALLCDPSPWQRVQCADRTPAVVDETLREATATPLGRRFALSGNGS